MRKFLLGTVILLVLTGVTAFLFREPLSLALVRRMAADRIGADAIAALPDGLHIGLCGAGSPFTDDRRSGPCTLVIAGQRMWVFDVGSGSARVISKMGFNPGRIDGIFLTHFHSDHIDGLGELMLQRWVSVGNTSPVPVYGAPGIEAVLAGWMQAYALDKGYRVAHHGAATVVPSGFGGVAKVFFLGPQGRVVVFKDADLEITAFEVNHAPVHPAVGYRIVYKGRSVVLSGDTQKSAAVVREATGADILVHEALSTPLVGLLKEAATAAGRTNLVKIFDDILNYHASPEEAAQTAQDAKVGTLVLNHIVPILPPLPGLEKVFLGKAADLFSGPIRVGLDGDFFSLPAHTTTTTTSRRF